MAPRNDVDGDGGIGEERVSDDLRAVLGPRLDMQTGELQAEDDAGLSPRRGGVGGGGERRDLAVVAHVAHVQALDASVESHLARDVDLDAGCAVAGARDHRQVPDILGAKAGVGEASLHRVDGERRARRGEAPHAVLGSGEAKVVNARIDGSMAPINPAAVPDPAGDCVMAVMCGEEAAPQLVLAIRGRKRGPHPHHRRRAHRRDSPPPAFRAAPPRATNSSSSRLSSSAEREISGAVRASAAA